jgi:hypothetical protein
VDGRLRTELSGQLAALIQLGSGHGSGIEHPRTGGPGVQTTLVSQLSDECVMGGWLRGPTTSVTCT